MTDVVLHADALSKQYRIGVRPQRYRTARDVIASAFTARSRVRRAASERPEETIWALKDVSFEVRRGEIVGVVGRNGAGKSTLLKVLSRITEPTAGFVDVAGRVGALLEVGTGFHLELTGRENIYLNAAILGMRRQLVNRQFDAIVDFAEVAPFIDTPVKHYSSGMYLRLAFAVAAHLQPDILLIDEVLAVGDVGFQARCLGKMGEVASAGRTVLFVSHNMSAITQLCTRALLLDAGRIAFSGRPAECVAEYLRRMDTDSKSRASNRSGTSIGPVRVNGGATPTVTSGRGFAMTVALHAEQLRNPLMYFIIEDAAGRSVVHSRVAAQDVGLPVLEGPCSVHVTIPALWLSAGVYSAYFKFLVSAPDGSDGCLYSPRLPLEVVGEMERTGKAVLNPPIAWETTSAPDAPGRPSYVDATGVAR